eukprot:Tbor_TRINITY_DN5963_c0_g3::TRINITY_DN5963_c0_g3_i1::g.19295::m.19295/K17362/ACOT13; acyl-coenzyme A thioesterase 13
MTSTGQYIMLYGCIVLTNNTCKQNKMSLPSSLFAQVKKAAYRFRTSHPNSFGYSILQSVRFDPEVDVYQCPKSDELIFSFRVTEDCCNSMNSLHEGSIATLADIFTTIHLWGIKPDKSHVSTNLNISYLQGAMCGTEAKLKSKVVRYAGSFAFVDFSVTNETGLLLATGTHIKYVISPKVVVSR